MSKGKAKKRKVKERQRGEIIEALESIAISLTAIAEAQGKAAAEMKFAGHKIAQDLGRIVDHQRQAAHEASAIRVILQGAAKALGARGGES
jgi:PIN domain nuclease of toxin-antitoxin system